MYLCQSGSYETVKQQLTRIRPAASGLLGRQVLRAFELDGWKAIGTALNRVNPPSIIKLDLVGDGEIERVLDDVKYAAKPNSCHSAAYIH